MEYIFIILDLINLNIQNHYYYSIFLYFLFLCVFFALSLPGGTILILGSGFFFGILIGFIINLFSIVICSFVFFLVSKFLFRSFLKNQYEYYSDKMYKIIKKSSYEYLILLRMILGPPLFVQNLCLSILNINKSKFLISSLIGFSPLLFLFTYVGNKLSNLLQIKNFKVLDLFTLDILLIFFLLFSAIIIKIIYNNKRI